jgi:hypothetical protein
LKHGAAPGDLEELVDCVVLRDFRFGARNLARNRSFTAVAIAR